MKLKSQKCSLTISETLILFIHYFTKEAHDRNIHGALGWSQWMPPVEWVGEKASKLHIQQIPHEDLFPRSASFHCLLSFTFVTFLIHWPLSWTYIWNIQLRWSIYVCILCGLLSCDSSHICLIYLTYMNCFLCKTKALNKQISEFCKRCCRIFARHYSLYDYSECSMDYELSLLYKVISPFSCTLYSCGLRYYTVPMMPKRIKKQMLSFTVMVIQLNMLNALVED